LTGENENDSKAYDESNQHAGEMPAKSVQMSEHSSGLLNCLSYDIGERAFFRFIIQELDDFPHSSDWQQDQPQEPPKKCRYSFPEVKEKFLHRVYDDAFLSMGLT
jgi:hypothetical protein